MAWVAVDKDGAELITDRKLERRSIDWGGNGQFIELPKGSIEKLIGKKLTWEDEPVELKKD